MICFRVFESNIFIIKSLLVLKSDSSSNESQFARVHTSTGSGAKLQMDFNISLQLEFKSLIKINIWFQLCYQMIYF